MSRYQLQEGGGVYDTKHNRSIPPSMSNRHWRAYKASGEVADPIPPADPKDAIRANLTRSDRGMARIVEDVINSLIAKELLTMADLPQKVQDKLTERAALRASLGE